MNVISINIIIVYEHVHRFYIHQSALSTNQEHLYSILSTFDSRSFYNRD